jgi:hypothetical protein
MAQQSDLVRNLYDAFARGDIPTVLGALAPDATWTESEGGPYGGTYRGADAILKGVFMKLGGEWDGFAAVPAQFVAAGDTVVVLGEYSGTFKATGRTFRAPFAHVWKLSDGRVATFTQITDTVLHRRAMDQE